MKSFKKHVVAVAAAAAANELFTEQSLLKIWKGGTPFMGRMTKTRFSPKAVAFAQRNLSIQSSCSESALGYICIEANSSTSVNSRIVAIVYPPSQYSANWQLLLRFSEVRVACKYCYHPVPQFCRACASSLPLMVATDVDRKSLLDCDAVDFLESVEAII